MKSIITSIIIILIYVSSVYSQWFTQYTSNPAQTIMALKFYDNNTGYHSGVLYNGSTLNIYKTTNGGLNYTAQNSSYTAQRFMSIFIIHHDTVLICGNYGKILRTFNGGQSWIPYVYADTNIQFWGMHFVNSNTGFVAGSYGTILKTTNKGENWIQQTTTYQNALDGIWFINENTGYVGGSNIILKTTDAGSNWVNKVGSFISGFETAQSVYFSDVNTGYYCTNTSNCRIVKTTDGGDTWNLIFSQNDAGAGWGMSFPNPLTGYVCTGAGKVVKTTDSGVTWGIQNTPLTENLYEIHFPSAQTGYIASWSGKILKTTNGGLTYITHTENEFPDNYSLSQNYPNPFNPSTKIKFEIPDNLSFQRKLESRKISLIVYDILGKEIAALVKEQLQPGSYEVTFNSDNLPGGVYFYKLTAGEFTETKKMLMIK